ncbi:MAG: 50S ribosomal protein L10 [Acidobacteriota bacterium]|nr:50S ribosomal protein L10 [Acidobacteriota bacterium]
MNRAEKIEAVETYKKTFEENPHMVLATFSGLTVNQVNSLRNSVRDAGGEYRVIKNRLAKLAAAGTTAEKLAGDFSGPCAMATHADDPVALAKSLATFAKENPEVRLLAGVVEGKDLLDTAGLTQLSKLPGLQELRAQLLALINTPATTLVRLVQTPGTQLARVIDAREGEAAADA